MFTFASAAFCLVCLLLALLFLVLWRVATRHAAERDFLWRAAVRLLANQDYQGVRDLVAGILPRPPHHPPGSPRTVAALELQAAAERMEIDYVEEQRARGDLEDVLSSLQDAVLQVDGETRVRYMNPAAIELLAVRIEDVLGARLIEALPAFGLDSAVRVALNDGVSTARDVSFYGPAVRELFLRVAPVRRSDGTVSGALAIIQDFTEIRRLERVRRDFVANASHELRTPIANIRASAETILDSPEDPALIGRFLPNLVQEAERLSHLVTDLLELARADSQAQDNRADFDLAAVAREVVTRLAEKAVQNEIQVYSDCDALARVLGDAAAIEQVLFNLLDNALLHTPRGSRVHVSTRRDPSEEVAYFIVADNGNGIPAADLPRVFERFYRVDKARSRSQGGTGLGLAIVKHIVENHGGHVKIDSEVGQGTTFTVTLPAA